MKILKRLNDLSVDDLRKLQAIILCEIQRRKELPSLAKATTNGPATGERKSSKGKRSVPDLKLVPAPARCAAPRRAA